MPKIEFSFFYRAAANYKTFASIVFAYLENIPLEVIRKTILASCNVIGNFDPRPWGIPNIRTQPHHPESDHVEDPAKRELVCICARPEDHLTKGFPRFVPVPLPHFV